MVGVNSGTAIWAEINRLQSKTYSVDRQVEELVKARIDPDFLEFLQEVVELNPELKAAYTAFKTRKRMGVK
jgi:hypothetical protein